MFSMLNASLAIGENLGARCETEDGSLLVLSDVSRGNGIILQQGTLSTALVSHYPTKCGRITPQSAEKYTIRRMWQFLKCVERLKLGYYGVLHDAETVKYWPTDGIWRAPSGLRRSLVLFLGGSYSTVHL